MDTENNIVLTHQVINGVYLMNQQMSVSSSQNGHRLQRHHKIRRSKPFQLVRHWEYYGQ